MIRFHLDESAESGVANSSRRRGIDITMPHDVGLAGASDAEHLSFALREARVIVSHDRDFLRHAAQAVPHAGIAYCPHGSRSIGDLVRSLILLRDTYSAEEMIDRVEYL